MIQATPRPRLPLGLLPVAALGKRASLAVDPWIAGTAGLAIFALAIRLAAAGQQSAYMDEGTNILTGRMLIEQHAIYAEILNWAYGSYLWPLVAGLADELGGLELVRGVTAVCGVLMVLATTAAAFRLSPESVPRERRWAIALLAGFIMAVAPTAVAVGRFGTYDALAGAAFMLGVTLLVPAGNRRGRLPLVLAAVLLFVAFLAKYVVAIYFPFICVYVVAANFRRIRVAIHQIVWFVIPLGALCAGYALVFLAPLLLLLTSSLHYSDLKSPQPLNVYVWTRPELWVLVALALVLGWPRATWNGRLIALGGTAIIAAFQIEARPDFDFWKHSIYVIYFLAPLAGLSWLAVPQNTGTWRVVAVLSAGLAAIFAWSPAIQQANRLIDFYPNLNPSMAAIDANISGSALVLTDDTALRYYLYPKMATDRVVGPFFFTYQAQDGLEAYRLAIANRFFDAIVLDGGVTPQGNAIGQQLGQDIQASYQQVYTQTEAGSTVEVFKPIRPQDDASAQTDTNTATWPVALTFSNPDQASLANWGAHPDNGDWQAGLQVSPTDEQLWNGQSTLRFTPSADSSTVSLRYTGSVTRMRARVFLVTADGGSTPVRVGFMGFDDAWQWHDDGFRWLVPPGTWTTITWDLASPGAYNEVGLKLSPGVQAAYLGSFEIDP